MATALTDKEEPQLEANLAQLEATVALFRPLLATITAHLLEDDALSESDRQHALAYAEATTSANATLRTFAAQYLTRYYANVPAALRPLVEGN